MDLHGWKTMLNFASDWKSGDKKNAQLQIINVRKETTNVRKRTSRPNQEQPSRENFPPFVVVAMRVPHKAMPWR